ncbi:MAG: acylneuraminate cytidylyltransferase family protein [Patescibacteria group bacterium]
MVNKLEVLAIVPARGGSKSIPKKNIIDLSGKPLISYALAAIKNSKSVNRVIVSTDDQEIAGVAKKYGAEVPFLRPAELATDTAPTMPVLRHVLDQLKQSEGYEPSWVLLVQPTSPFIKTEEIDAAIELIKKNSEADSVTSVIEVPNNFHPINSRLITEDGWLQFVDPVERAKYNQRQSKPRRYAIGNLWVFTLEVIQKKDIPIGDRCLPLVITSMSAFDIDTLEDLEIAEALLPIALRGDSIK